jgi:hypothetical protein
MREILYGVSALLPDTMRTSEEQDGRQLPLRPPDGPAFFPKNKTESADVAKCHVCTGLQITRSNALDRLAKCSELAVEDGGGSVGWARL